MERVLARWPRASLPVEVHSRVGFWQLMRSIALNFTSITSAYMEAIFQSRVRQPESFSCRPTLRLLLKIHPRSISSQRACTSVYALSRRLSGLHSTDCRSSNGREKVHVGSGVAQQGVKLIPDVHVEG